MEGNRLAPRRPRTRRVTVLAAWVLATLLGLGVAATTRVGPTVLTLSADHGVHLGDVVAFAVAYAAALVITLRPGASTARPQELVDMVLRALRDARPRSRWWRGER